MDSKHIKVDQNQQIETLKKNVAPICFVLLHVKSYMALCLVPFGVVREPQISRVHIYVCVLYSITYKNCHFYALFSNIFFLFVLLD